MKKETALKNLIKYYAYLLIIWGFYRLLLFQFPAPLEILIIKPLVWLAPLYLIIKSEKIKPQELGLTTHKLFTSIYIALILGVVFTFEGLLINFIKYKGRFVFESNIGSSDFLLTVILSFATAFTEELAFRGYIFTQIQKFVNQEWIANFITAISWTFIHLPIASLDWRLGAQNLLLYLTLVFTFSVGASYIFARTKNLSSSIFLHVLWQWPIILYR